MKVLLIMLTFFGGFKDRLKIKISSITNHTVMKGSIIECNSRIITK